MNPVPVDAQDEFHLFQSAKKAGVYGIDCVREVKGRLGALRPPSGRAKEFLRARVADEQCDLR